MRVSACTELKASKSLDSFVKIQNGVYRKNVFCQPRLIAHPFAVISTHCRLVAATPVQICASSKTLKCVKTPLSRNDAGGPDLILRSGIWPCTTELDRRAKIRARVFYFLGNRGDIFQLRIHHVVTVKKLKGNKSLSSWGFKAHLSVQ